MISNSLYLITDQTKLLRYRCEHGYWKRVSLRGSRTICTLWRHWLKQLVENSQTAKERPITIMRIFASVSFVPCTGLWRRKVQKLGIPRIVWLPYPIPVPMAVSQSGIDIFAWRVSWNYAYSPFKQESLWRYHIQNK